MFITVCPHCNTQFYISPEQIELAEGQVRCGRCGEIFDSTQTRSKEPITEDLFAEELLPNELSSPKPPTSPQITQGGYMVNVNRYLGSKINLTSSIVEPTNTVTVIAENVARPSDFSETEPTDANILPKKKSSKKLWAIASSIALLLLLLQGIYLY